MTAITFKGNLLTTKRIVIYVLLFIVALTLLTYTYFTYWSYPLFQLMGAWQDATLIPQIFLGVTGILAFTHFLFSCIFKDQVQLQLREGTLLIASGKENLPVPLSQIKRINFIYRNERLSRITIHASKKYYLNVEDIFKGLHEGDFKPWVGSLKSMLQKEFSFKEDVKQQQVSKTNNIIYYLYAPSYDLKAKRRNYKRWIIIGIFIWLLIVGLVIYILTRLNDDGININGENHGGSRFSRSGSKIYYLHVGKGYYELKEADPTSFLPFTFGNEYGTEMGADKRFVYYGNYKTEGINREKAVYLGKNYIRDDKKVFYTNIPVANADVNTFRSVYSQYNTMAFTYATDTNSVYYKQHRLNKLVPAQIRFFDEVLNVVADSNHVYYKDTLLSGLNGSKAQVRRIDRYLVYATDGAGKHFVNDLAFPGSVPDNIFGTVKVNLSKLNLLQEKNSGSAHLLFYDDHHIYYYDEKRREFLHSKSFKEELHFQKTGNRVFTDGEYIYFTERGKLGTRSRGGSFNSLGVQTAVYKFKNVRAENFKRIATGNEYEIFSDGEKQYISILNYGNRINVTSGLYYLKIQNMANVNNITKKDIDIITDKEKILKINSRNYYPKDED